MPKIADRHLVLCPGIMNDRGLWARMEKGLAVLSRCHFADLGQDASLAEIARRVLGVAPAKFVLIGFSMGGYVAREVVRQPQRPDRSSRRTRITRCTVVIAVSKATK